MAVATRDLARIKLTDVEGKLKRQQVRRCCRGPAGIRKSLRLPARCRWWWSQSRHTNTFR
jgi:hypothetical protein